MTEVSKVSNDQLKVQQAQVQRDGKALDNKVNRWNLLYNAAEGVAVVALAPLTCLTGCTPPSKPVDPGNINPPAPEPDVPPDTDPRGYYIKSATVADASINSATVYFGVPGPVTIGLIGPDAKVHGLPASAFLGDLKDADIPGDLAGKVAFGTLVKNGGVEAQADISNGTAASVNSTDDKDVVVVNLSAGLLTPGDPGNLYPEDNDWTYGWKMFTYFKPTGTEINPNWQTEVAPYVTSVDPADPRLKNFWPTDLGIRMSTDPSVRTNLHAYNLGQSFYNVDPRQALFTTFFYAGTEAEKAFLPVQAWMQKSLDENGTAVLSPFGTLPDVPPAATREEIDQFLTGTTGASLPQTATGLAEVEGIDFSDSTLDAYSVADGIYYNTARNAEANRPDGLVIDGRSQQGLVASVNSGHDIKDAVFSMGGIYKTPSVNVGIPDNGYSLALQLNSIKDAPAPVNP